MVSLQSITLISVLFFVINCVTYYKESSDAYSRSSFSLPYAAAGEIVTAEISIYETAPAYLVQLWAPNTYYPSAPAQVGSRAGSALYESLPLSESGNWRLTVLPLSLSFSQMFRFSIIIKVAGRSAGSYMDVARYQRMFVIYHSLSGTQKIEVVTPINYVNDAILKLFGPFPDMRVSGNGVGDAVGTSTSVGSQLTYSTNGREYYYLVVEATDSLMSSGQPIKVTYNTDRYECPYNTGQRDYNSVFLGCTHLMPTIDFPCIDFDGITCRKCAPQYDITDYGRCQFKISCPDEHYFKFGSCLPKLKNCAEYERIGGHCHLCDTGFQLTQLEDFSQFCEPIILQNECGQNSYRRGERCFEFVQNCADFEMSVGICHNCQAGYRESENKCIKLPSTLNCEEDDIEVNGACITRDAHCIFYDAENVCEVCATGYQLDSDTFICTKIECEDRYYPNKGECVPVSGTCATYDPAYGHCLTCVFFHYLFHNTVCLQVLPEAVGQITQEQPCPDNYYRREGTCVRVNELCGEYNIDTGLCTSCVNSTYYLKKGDCRSIIQFCGYRTYFADGDCLPVSPLCQNYDPTTGYCISCRDNTRLNDRGRCLFNYTCGEREYYAFDGSCQKVSDLCGDFNPETGECITCSEEYDLNINEGTGKKYCCYNKNYLLDSDCVQFLTEKCTKLHDRFKYCVQCEPGYARRTTPMEGLLVFSKCIPS